MKYYRNVMLIRNFHNIRLLLRTYNGSLWFQLSPNLHAFPRPLSRTSRSGQHRNRQAAPSPIHQILLSLSRSNGAAVLSSGGEASFPSRRHGPGDVLGHGQPGHQAQDVPLLRPGALGRLPARHQGGDGRRSVSGALLGELSGYQVTTEPCLLTFQLLE